MSFKAAIEEAFVVAPTNVFIYETLEVSHSSLPAGTLYMVRDVKELTATLEDSSVVTFDPVPFAITLPAAGESGHQDLNIKIDNIDRRVSDFVKAAKEYDDPITVVYRPYLSTDLTTPQMDPPLSLTLKEITMTVMGIQARASFFDVVNKRFPSELYTRVRFPSIGS